MADNREHYVYKRSYEDWLSEVVNFINSVNVVNICEYKSCLHSIGDDKVLNIIIYYEQP